MQAGHAQPGGRGLHGARDDHDRPLAATPIHGRVLPVHGPGGAQGLGDGLLGGEPRGQGLQRQVTLLGSEEPLPQGRGAFEGVPEAGDVDDVDPDPDDHAAPRPLTRR